HRLGTEPHAQLLAEGPLEALELPQRAVAVPGPDEGADHREVRLLVRGVDLQHVLPASRETQDVDVQAGQPLALGVGPLGVPRSVAAVLRPSPSSWWRARWRRSNGRGAPLRSPARTRARTTAGVASSSAGSTSSPPSQRPAKRRTSTYRRVSRSRSASAHSAY